MNLLDDESRRLAAFQEVTKPLGEKLEVTGLDYLRGLVLKYQQQKQEVHLDTRFQNQTQPKYYQTCGYLIPAGTRRRVIQGCHHIDLFARLIPTGTTIKRHTGYSSRSRRWAPVTLQAILESETYYRYNNRWLRPTAQIDRKSGRLTPLWGREEMEADWQPRGDVRAFLQAELNAVALYLREHKGLAILLEHRTPRLIQLSQLNDATRLLGYVAYFLDCWQRLRENEQVSHAAMVQVNSLAKSAPGKLSLRQVALLYVYTGLTIPPNADAIAKQYGHESGRTLYKRYLEVVQTAGRVGADIQGKKLAPMIADIAAIVPYLPQDSRQQVESELQTLEKRK